MWWQSGGYRLYHRIGWWVEEADRGRGGDPFFSLGGGSAFCLGGEPGYGYPAAGYRDGGDKRHEAGQAFAPGRGSNADCLHHGLYGLYRRGLWCGGAALSVKACDRGASGAGAWSGLGEDQDQRAYALAYAAGRRGAAVGVWDPLSGGHAQLHHRPRGGGLQCQAQSERSGEGTGRGLLPDSSLFYRESALCETHHPDGGDP